VGTDNQSVVHTHDTHTHTHTHSASTAHRAMFNSATTTTTHTHHHFSQRHVKNCPLYSAFEDGRSVVVDLWPLSFWTTDSGYLHSHHAPHSNLLAQTHALMTGLISAATSHLFLCSCL
jgi:hypothetical protein